jgi:hypothetical protein
MNCKNCDAETLSKFCPDCGQPANLKKIDGNYIIHEIEHVLHFERGILYTIRELTIRPGNNIRKYLTENRSRLVKPIIFIIITSLIYSIVINIFHIEDGYIKFEGEGANLSTFKKIFDWVQGHYGYTNIILGVFIAFWLKLFFKKYQFNFFEILIMLCFVMGISMLIYAVFAILAGLISLKISQIGGIFGFIYSTWAIGQFFEQGNFFNYVKVLLANFLGFITFIFSIFLLGLLIDLIIKH